MGKKILVILFLLFKVGSVSASQNIAGDSAKISLGQNIRRANKSSYKDSVIAQNIKKQAMAKVLQKYQSPLVADIDSFVTTCQAEQIDCYLLPSIAGLESLFGRYIYPDSYNPFGWNGGYARFRNWNEAIQTVGQGLNERYIGRGAETIEQIGRTYSESPTWAYRIRHFMTEFKSQEEANSLNFSTVVSRL